MWAASWTHALYPFHLISKHEWCYYTWCRHAFSHRDVVVYGEMQEEEAAWSREGQTWSVLREANWHTPLLKLPACVCPCVRGTWLEPRALRVALRVCVGHITVKGGFLGVHVGQNSEMVCDGQGETRRISLVCLRECSNTHTKGEICLQDGFHVHGMRGVGQAFWFVCVCVHTICVSLGHRPWDHLLQSFSQTAQGHRHTAWLNNTKLLCVASLLLSCNTKIMRYYSSLWKLTI